MCVDFGGNCLCNHCFPSTWRSVKKNPFWRVDAEASEQFWMLEWQLNHLSNFLQLLADASNILVCDSFGLTNIFVVNGFVLDDDVRIACDLDDPFWRGLDNCKW